MNQKTFVILAVLAVVVGAIAMLVDRRGRPASPDRAGDAQPLLFPDLASRANDIAELAVKRDDGTLTVKKVGEQWLIQEKGDYPARIDKVRDAVISLSRLKGVEAKTSNPDRFADISVQDPGTAPVKEGKQAPTLVIVSDAGGRPLASLVVGDVKWGARQQVFVRRHGENQSWLAEVDGGAAGARLEITAAPSNWISMEIANIARDRIASVVLRHPPSSVDAEAEVIAALRDDPSTTGFTLRGIPAGRSLKTPNSGDSLANAISYLNLEDVASAASMASEFTEERTTAAEFRTFDGLVLTARLATIEGRTWAVFEPSFDESRTPDVVAVSDDAEPQVRSASESANRENAARADAVKAEIAALSDKVEGWAFHIPEWKARTFLTRWNDLLAEPADSAP